MSLDGNLTSLSQNTGNDAGASDGFQASLSDIASGFLQGIANAASRGIGNLVDNTTRSSNTQPTPDLSAAAAKPQVAAFVDAKAFGVSMPILILGVGALAFILIKR